MINTSHFLINYSVDASGVKPVVSVSTSGTPPDIMNSIISKIDSVYKSFNSTYSVITQKLVDLESALLENSLAFKPEYSSDIASEYTLAISVINDTLKVDPNLIPSVSQQNQAKKQLRVLKKQYRNNNINVPMLGSSKQATKTSSSLIHAPIQRVIQKISLEDLNVKISEVSSQLPVLGQNDTNISTALTNISSKLTSRNKFVSNSSILNRNGASKIKAPIIKQSSLEISVTNLKEAIQTNFITLQSYAQTALTQIENNVNSGDASKINSLFNLFKSGLSTQSLNLIKSEVENVQGEISLLIANTSTNLRPSSRRSRMNISNDNNTLSVINATIQSLKNERTQKSEAYAKILESGSIDQQTIDDFTETLTRINNEIATLESQKGTTSQIIGNTTRGLPKFAKNIGSNIGQSRLGKYFNMFVNANRATKSLSSIDQEKIKATISNLTVTQPTTIPLPTTKSGFLSSLTVNTSSSGNLINVNFNIIINDVETSGVFDINSLGLSYISYEMISNTSKLSLSAKNHLCNQYGNATTNATNVDVWNAYLIFIYSYLSLVCANILNSDSINEITIPEGSSMNLISFLSLKLIDSIAGLSIPLIGLGKDRDIKNIIQLASSDMFSGYFYSETNQETIGNIVSNQVLISSFEKVRKLST